MSESQDEPLAVVVERELPHAPAKIWRALTQPHLIKEWLMKTDFEPVSGHRFKFQGDWGAVDCQVKVVETDKTLAYSWEAFGLQSLVTWTLTPTESGTRLRMEQIGFRPDQQRAFEGAKQGWRNFFAGLERVLADLS
jgi:uncharacterized protein YndB with AHSA1/START domain